MKPSTLLQSLLIPLLLLALAGLAAPLSAATDDAGGPGLEPLRQMLQERIAAMEQARDQVRTQERAMLAEMVTECQGDLERLQRREQTREQVQANIARMEQTAARHEDRLRQMMGQASPEARPALERAVAATQRVRTMAQEHLRVAAEHQEGMPEGARRETMRPSDMRPPGAGRPESMPGMGPGGMGGAGGTRTRPDMGMPQR